MLKRALVLVAAGLVIFPIAAKAATEKPTGRISFRTNHVDIVLSGYCQEVLGVSVVMDGKEDKAFPAVVDPQDGCHWTATRKLGDFDTEFAQFSLRLGVARTTCQNGDGDAGNHLVQLVFRCCKTEARLVEIQTPDEIAISYVRGVPPDLTYDDRSVGCVETYPFVALPVRIHSVWFPAAALSGAPPSLFRKTAPPFETVWIQFNAKANPKAPGLIINDATVTQYLKKGPRLSSKQIVDALLKQQCQGKAGTPPYCPPVASDGYLQELRDLHLTNISVTLMAK